MSEIDFYSFTVDFDGVSPSGSGEITKSISHKFPTQILKGNVALQSWEVNYDSHNHEFYAAAAKIENVFTSEDTISCDVTLRLHNNMNDYIQSGTAYARVLYIAERE
uniref:Uncharacterized protein n=1 Tax=Pseudoderbesia arbuscula TaxID=2320809 RepID=A0A386AYS4_9CHLO|nr:hypothetical protein [Pseudoderbesia arbuscula]